MPCTVSASIPYAAAPISISPLNLSRTRLYAGSIATPSPSTMLLTELVAREATHLDVLVRRRHGVLDHLPDRPLGVFHPRLVEQARLLGKLLQAPFDHLVHDRLGLPFGQ